MAEYSRFFGGPAGSVPEYDQNDFSGVLKRLIGDGVLTDITNQLVVAETDPVSLAVKIDTGEAFIQGFWYQNTTAITKALSAADATYNRIDRIVLRLDKVTNFKISVEILEGTPAASPTAPALTQTDAIYEISLAQVLVEANVTSVSNAKITDERSFVESKGLENVVKLTGDQTIAGVKTFGDGIKTDTIDEETAGAGVTVDGINLKDNLDTSNIVSKSGNQTIAGVKTFSGRLSPTGGFGYVAFTSTGGASKSFDIGANDSGFFICNAQYSGNALRRTSVWLLTICSYHSAYLLLGTKYSGTTEPSNFTIAITDNGSGSGYTHTVTVDVPNSEYAYGYWIKI